jgi:hypothetical protein
MPSAKLFAMLRDALFVSPKFENHLSNLADTHTSGKYETENTVQSRMARRRKRKQVEEKGVPRERIASERDRGM